MGGLEILVESGEGATGNVISLRLFSKDLKDASGSTKFLQGWSPDFK